MEEAVVVELKLIFLLLPGGTEENKEKSQSE
jgi:hypothetical protein